MSAFFSDGAIAMGGVIAGDLGWTAPTHRSHGIGGQSNPEMSDEPQTDCRSMTRASRTVASMLRGLRVIVLAVLVLPGLAAAQANPRLANLRVEIWPEYDRQAVLVIIKGELSPDTPLPAELSLRLPASAGGPSAVAFANAPGSELFNLQHNVTASGDYGTLRFATPQRFFHVEYYDALATSAPTRTYTYAWTGDFAVDRLNVTLQEPAAASDVSTLPDLGRPAAGGDGFHYRTLDLGPYETGKELFIAIRYTKQDSRTSAQILKLGTPAGKSPAPAGPAASYPAWLPITATLLGLSLGAPVLWWVWRRRKAGRQLKPLVAGFCPRCGKGLGPGDRYCSSCGAPVQKT